MKSIYTSITSIVLVALMQNVYAKCWINCDSTPRNISTDKANLLEALTNDGFSENRVDSELSYMCRQGIAIAIKKDNENELLSIKVGGVSKERAAYIGGQLKGWMNYGLSGFSDDISPDKRCIFKQYEGAAIYGMMVCDYKNSTNLPVSEDLVLRKLRSMNMESYCN